MQPLILQCTITHLKKQVDPNLDTLMSYSRRKVAAARAANHQKVTESVTLRFDRYILERLKKDANDKQISLNTLMNQIVTQHLDWHANASKAGFIAIGKGTVVKMLEKIPEQDVVDIAEFVAKKESKGFIMLLSNEYNVISALEVLETWIKIAGYSYRHEARGSEHSFIIHHDMSRKWSLYLTELFRFISEDFGLSRVDFDIDENAISFRVDTDGSLSGRGRSREAQREK